MTGPELSGSFASVYGELKSWQTGIGAVIGFFALGAAALWNFHLNRRRDQDIRDQERISVASAIYGEILQLREQLALLARLVANIETRGGDDFRIVRTDLYRPSEPIIYRALAPKLGLLDADLVLGVIRFYTCVSEADRGLIDLVSEYEGPKFGPTIVLRPAVSGVEDVLLFLRMIESQTGAPPTLESLDLGFAPDVIELENFRREEANAGKS